MYSYKTLDNIRVRRVTEAAALYTSLNRYKQNIIWTFNIKSSFIVKNIFFIFILLKRDFVEK